MTLTLDQITRFLVDKLGNGSDNDIDDLTEIGAGSWSQCFGFTHGGHRFAAKFGIHGEDFELDRLACRFTVPDLPIPEILDSGEVFDGFYSIAPLVPGKPLESLTSPEWAAAIPSIVNTLEALRIAADGVGEGWGAWGTDGRGADASWRDFLLAIDDNDPTSRVAGWRERLRTMPGLNAEFEWGLAELDRVAIDDVPRGLVHNDMMYRNVHVENNQITGLFDWGISLYGDHLFDLAMIEFWAPWYPSIDASRLRAAACERWSGIPGALDRFEERWYACWLRIGTEHIGYNAYREDWADAERVAQRMRVNVLE